MMYINESCYCTEFRYVVDRVVKILQELGYDVAYGTPGDIGSSGRTPDEEVWGRHCSASRRSAVAQPSSATTSSTRPRTHPGADLLIIALLPDSGPLRPLLTNDFRRSPSGRLIEPEEMKVLSNNNHGTLVLIIFLINGFPRAVFNGCIQLILHDLLVSRVGLEPTTL